MRFRQGIHCMRDAFESRFCHVLLSCWVLIGDACVQASTSRSTIVRQQWMIRFMKRQVPSWSFKQLGPLFGVHTAFWSPWTLTYALVLAMVFLSETICKTGAFAHR